MSKEEQGGGAAPSSTTLLLQRIKDKKGSSVKLEGNTGAQDHHEINETTALDNIAKDLQIVKINLNDIFPNPYQPRKTFIHIDDLAQSIKDNGLLQPIVVARIDGKNFLVAGERRLRAQKQLALEDKYFQEIKSIVMPDLSIEQLKFYALIENIQRESMTLLETANAYKSLADDGLSMQEIATKVGKGKTSIHRYITIANQPSDILIAIERVGIDSPKKIESIVKANISDDDKISLIEKVGEGYKTSQIDNSIKRLLIGDKFPTQAKDKEDLFASAMIPIKKRSYISLPREDKAVANGYLQTISDAKRELLALFKKKATVSEDE